MMPLIQVCRVSKSYQIDHSNQKEASFSDFLGNRMKWFSKMSAGSSGEQKPSTETFWALDDVSFEVLEGEHTALIGGNGAGKSTLLKIMSKITTPTSGSIRYRGQITSLLEIGTGFHPDLTGRENIYLNGAILGISAKKIKHKFDEIVNFSGVEKFLDTPVRHFSSGMYVRLAFSVATNLNPDILILDEVLAVGDAEFQKKCRAKLDELAKSGCTMLIVNHGIENLIDFCSNAVILNHGKLLASGKINEVADIYKAMRS